MVSDLFSTLLEELSKSLQIQLLKPDSNQSCLLKLPNELEMQIELDKGGEMLILGSNLGTIPSGKYRQELFKAALKSNGSPHLIQGILAYSRKADQLIIFTRLPLRDLNGERIAAAFATFTEKALVWRNALRDQQIPENSSIYTSNRPGGLFGLMH